MIDTVLEHESHLFTPAEISLLQKMKRADCEFRCLLFKDTFQKVVHRLSAIPHLATCAAETRQMAPFRPLTYQLHSRIYQVHERSRT